MKSPTAASFATISAALSIAMCAAVAAPPSARAAEPAASPGTANYEIRFLEGMIDHHQMAVHMGELCLAKATHEELRELCGDIVSAQTAEIEIMQDWLSAWYGVEHEPEMKAGEMRRMMDLAALSGGEFEVRFVEEMIAHHRGAVREGRRCMQRAAHTELVELCGTIVDAQLAEIEQMSTWLCEWYGRCHHG